MADTGLPDIEATIRARSDLFEKHFADSNAAGLVADYYVDEPLMSVPDAPILRGREAITALFEGFMKDFSHCRLEQKFVRAGGDLAYEVSSAFLQPRGGGDQIECRYIITWRKCPDTWRVETDFFAYGQI